MRKLFVLVVLIIAYTGDFISTPVYADNGELPSWFFTQNGVVGVSDMDMDAEEALKQAIVRALFVQAVSEGVEISSVYELYYHMENGRDAIDNQKSHCLAEFKAQLTDYDYEVLDVFYTEYDEAVVLLNVYHGNDDGVQKNAEFNGSYMYYFDGTIRDPEYGDMLSLKTNTPDEELQSLAWLAITEKSSTTVYSTTDEKKERLLEKYYVYTQGGGIPKTVVNQNTKHGLWHCFTDTFMQAMSNFIPRKAIVSSTNRMISDFQSLNENSEYSDKVQDLVRLTYKTNVFCDITSLSCDKLNLYIDWNITEAGLTEETQLDGAQYTYEIEGYQAVVGPDYSKAKNESERIALITAANEIAKMAKFKISGVANDFSMMENEDFYQRYCDTTQISTILMMRNVEHVAVDETELKNGVYRSKIKTRVMRDNIVPIKRK